MDKKKVVLGLSGGVDSAVSAIILKEQGYEVHALYFDVLKKPDEETKRRAEDICRQLNISFHYVNASYRFNRIIIKNFCDEYKAGRTPMPCMLCNPYVKWFLLRQYADKIGAYYIASGHYGKLETVDDVTYVKKSANIKKDQSYMLARLDQNFLKRMIFPLSSFDNKDAVRAYAKSHGLILPEGLKESQDICFVKTDYKDFLKKHRVSFTPGNFIDTDGNVIGSHDGFEKFTIGQGKGFGKGFNKKMYVKAIDPETHNITLCENDKLFQNTVVIKLANFAKYGSTECIPDEYLNCSFDVKVRYAAAPAKAVITGLSDGKALLTFDVPQRAITPGQYCVMYKDDYVIGCGIIC